MVSLEGRPDEWARFTPRQRLQRFDQEAPAVFQMELPMLGVGILLALVAGLIAGIYPAWRICRIPPAAHLKAQ